LGVWREAFGKKVNVCGGARFFETKVFDDQSLEIMKTLIRMNYQIISEQGK